MELLFAILVCVAILSAPIVLITEVGLIVYHVKKQKENRKRFNDVIEQLATHHEKVEGAVCQNGQMIQVIREALDEAKDNRQELYEYLVQNQNGLLKAIQGKEALERPLLRPNRSPWGSK